MTIKEDILVELPGDRLLSEPCRLQTFSYRDASNISMIATTSDSLKLFEIINNRANIDICELTTKDFRFIMHWQRINSYSSFPMKSNWQCPHCAHPNTDEISSSNLVIKDLDQEYEHGLPIFFNGLNQNLKIRLNLIKDEVLVKKFFKQNPLIPETPEAFDELLAACMLEPNGGTLEERLEIVQNMSADDHFKMKAFEQKYDYGVSDHCEFTCENCKEVVKVRYRFDLTRFFPNIQDLSNVRPGVFSSETSGNGQHRGQGFHEDNIYTGNSSKESQGISREEEERSSQEQNETSLSISPEELQKLIQDGISQAKAENKYNSYYDDFLQERE